MASKIERYGLQEKILHLSAQPGMTTHKIAEILTEELDGNDSISQPTVSRWLKDVREDRNEQTRIIVQDYLKKNIPKDLDALEEVEAFFLHIFRNMTKDPETGELIFTDENGNEMNFDLKARADAGLKVVDIVVKKLRFGGLEDPSPPKDSKDYYDDEFIFNTARSGIRGIIRGLREAGITGPGPEQSIEDHS